MTAVEVKWNKDQLKAIEGRGGTVLVSAAAGSGKTAVLVERIIRRLCDTEKPVSIENFLIVTFTRAAAAQMREKIQRALKDRIAADPDNAVMRRNLLMLPYANICTIDSFCINLVRENFHKPEISPDFQIADNSALAIYEDLAANNTVAAFHENRQDEFRELNLLVNDNKSDSRIIEIIKELYTLSQAYVFPGYMLDGLYKEYTAESRIEDLPYCRESAENALKFITGKLKDIKELSDELNREIRLEGGEKKVAEKYLDIFSDDSGKLVQLESALKSGDWAVINRAFADLSFQKEAGGAVTPLKSRCKDIRTYTKDFFCKKYPCFYISSEEYRQSVEMTAPAIRTLIDAVKEYSQELRRIKDEENAYSFGDIMHFALDLLVENRNGVPVRKEFARELSSNYSEILVDEYQDVNKAQDTIFLALSRDDTNRFMVGDVKQSIYGFRQAMPEIFTDLRKSMSDYDGKNYPAKVNLSCNYRSRKGVTGTANFIFSALMSEKAGGVDYNETEFLNPQADYPVREKGDNDFEVYLLECEKAKQLESQAEFAAEYIKKAVESKLQVGRTGDTRDARYSDFCILMRSVSDKGKIFVKAFENAGIPLITEAENSLLSSPEVSLVISLLKAIDNPLNDIPLTAVLLSPIYGFTPDDLALMRAEHREGRIYECLAAYAGNGSEKAASFIAGLNKMRKIASTLPTGEFTAKIINESGLRAIIYAMANGGNRVSNLNAFINLAEKYEKTGAKGISAFVKFLEKLEGKEDAVPAAGCVSASDAVRLMTIHKSKGLEYPYVFLVNCEKQHNDMDSSNSLLVSRKSGIGLKYIKDNTRYETLSHLAAKDSIKADSHSEELRVLYVGLTRAKEKTIVVSASDDWEARLKKISSGIPAGGRFSPEAVLDMKSYDEYILSALLLHPDAHALRNAAEIDPGIKHNCETGLHCEIIKYNREEEQPAEEEKPVFRPDQALLEELRKRLTYTYPYEKLNKLTAKKIASDAGEEGFNEEYFAVSKPAFTNEGSLTPAQQGTATHRFMQYADYKSALSDIEKEKIRLVDEGMLTEAEAKAVNGGSVLKFLTSPLAKRIFSSPKVYKEYGFTVSLPLSEVYADIDPDIAGDDVIIIQGVADLAFEENGKLIIVDYKTDRASSADELREKYTPQLDTYRKCLSRALNIDVAETVIYSFRLGEEIRI